MSPLGPDCVKTFFPIDRRLAKRPIAPRTAVHEPVLCFGCGGLEAECKALEMLPTGRSPMANRIEGNPLVDGNGSTAAGRRGRRAQAARAGATQRIVRGRHGDGATRRKDRRGSHRSHQAVLRRIRPSHPRAWRRLRQPQRLRQPPRQGRLRGEPHRLLNQNRPQLNGDFSDRLLASLSIRIQPHLATLQFSLPAIFKRIQIRFVRRTHRFKNGNLIVARVAAF
jgi:hypothetical protein